MSTQVFMSLKLFTEPSTRAFKIGKQLYIIQTRKVKKTSMRLFSIILSQKTVLSRKHFKRLLCSFKVLDIDYLKSDYSEYIIIVIIHVPRWSLSEALNITTRCQTCPSLGICCVRECISHTACLTVPQPFMSKLNPLR